MAARSTQEVLSQIEELTVRELGVTFVDATIGQAHIYQLESRLEQYVDMSRDLRERARAHRPATGEEPLVQVVRAPHANGEMALLQLFSSKDKAITIEDLARSAGFAHVARVMDNASRTGKRLLDEILLDQEQHQGQDSEMSFQRHRLGPLKDALRAAFTELSSSDPVDSRLPLTKFLDNGASLAILTPQLRTQVATLAPADARIITDAYRGGFEHARALIGLAGEQIVAFARSDQPVSATSLKQPLENISFTHVDVAHDTASEYRLWIGAGLLAVGNEIRRTTHALSARRFVTAGVVESLPFMTEAKSITQDLRGDWPKIAERLLLARLQRDITHPEHLFGRPLQLEIQQSPQRLSQIADLFGVVPELLHRALSMEDTLAPLTEVEPVVPMTRPGSGIALRPHVRPGNQNGEYPHVQPPSNTSDFSPW
jgi:hypothetical protein